MAWPVSSTASKSFANGFSYSVSTAGEAAASVSSGQIGSFAGAPGCSRTSRGTRYPGSCCISSQTSPWMYTRRCHRIADRLVSLSQPHVRPIVRGKAGCPVEFGAKISVSLVEGVSFVDRISWEAYNESLDLVGQIEAYRRRFGHYPAAATFIGIYRV